MEFFNSRITEKLASQKVTGIATPEINIYLHKEACKVFIFKGLLMQNYLH